MFKKGEAVIHPARGAGVIVGFSKFKRDGSTKRYYRIKLLHDSSAMLMVPVEASNTALRPPLSQSRIKRMWRLLRADPNVLPDDYKSRQKETEEKLISGDILQVTEVVRDMTWRQHEKKDLTKRGKAMLERGVELLTGEIAAAEGIDLARAMEQINTQLHTNLPSEVT